MKITTQDSFIDCEISETLGLVKGNTIRARHIGKDIMASLRTLVGGEIIPKCLRKLESKQWIA